MTTNSRLRISLARALTKQASQSVSMREAGSLCVNLMVTDKYTIFKIILVMTDNLARIILRLFGGKPLHKHA